MGLKKTVASMLVFFVDFMQNSASQVSLGLDQGLPAGNQGQGQTQSRDHSESLPRNRSSVRNSSVCLVADDWDGSSWFDPDLQFESLLADQTPNADLRSDSDNEPENSASLLGTEQGSELDNEALISLQEFYNSEEVSDKVLRQRKSAQMKVIGCL